jgi:predicted Fe-Mo cluster-binding NifX family protein
MKITVSARGKTIDSEMDPRFGRTAGFVLFDTETGQTAYLDNSAQIGLAQGTGIKAAQMIADAGTDVLITGQMGPKAAQVLSRSGIKLYIGTAGTVQDVIQALERNELNELAIDTLQAGPGKMGGRGMGGGGRGMGGGGRGMGGGGRSGF